MQLQGKIAVVTGADSGIGQAAAELFAREGADVALSYHTDKEGADETKRRVEAAGRRAFVAQADVGDPAAVQTLFDGAKQALGTPDLLLANAGTGMSDMPVAEMQDDKLKQVLRADLIGPLYCARAFIRQRQAAGGKGRLIFTGSVSGHLPDWAARPMEWPRPGSTRWYAACRVSWPSSASTSMRSHLG